jgi:hypothetical protein
VAEAVTYVYPLFQFHGINYRMLGVFLTEESGREALIKCPDDDDHGYQLEEWPADTQASRTFIRVVDSK